MIVCYVVHINLCKTVRVRNTRVGLTELLQFIFQVKVSFSHASGASFYYLLLLCSGLSFLDFFLRIGISFLFRVIHLTEQTKLVDS